MKKINRLFAAAMVTIAGIGVASAETTIINYSYGSEDNQKIWGSKKAETYDIAIRIVDPGMVGSKLVGMFVPVETTEYIDGFKAWLTTELALTTVDGQRVNKADICTVDVTPEGNMLRVKFDEPYTITKDGVYVGYSFTVNQVLTTEEEQAMGDDFVDKNKYPVHVNPYVTENGMYVHTTRTYRSWKDYSETLNATSTITAEIEGNFKSNAVGLLSVPEANITAGKAAVVSLPVINHGSTPITKVGYTYKVKASADSDEIIAEGSGVADTNVEGNLNAEGTLDIVLDPIDEKGSFYLEVTAEYVNGVQNEDSGRTGGNTLCVLALVPKNRPVMEEWTGTWCGYCPRGMLAMEELNKLYDDFVGIAYHQGDPMQLASGYPNMADGFPKAFINRKSGIDPYYGSSLVSFGSKDDYIAASKVFTPVNIDLKTEWLDEGKTQLKATVTLLWVKEQRKACSVNLVLTADGLTGTGDSWEQKNYFAGNSTYMSDPILKQLVSMSGSISGLKFNDVAVQVSGMQTVGEITVDEPKVIEYVFDISNNKIIQDKENLRVAVEVLENIGTYGQIINGLKEKKAGDTTLSTGSLSADANVVETAYYDLSGRVVRTPQQGIYVKVERMSDGTSRSKKIMVR